MVFDKTKYERVVREQMYGAPGTVYIDNINGDCPPNSRLIAEITINPGCGIGTHKHDNEAEIYHMISGELTLNDNGTECILKAGQTHICYSGCEHGGINNGTEPVVLLAVIITDK